MKTLTRMENFLFRLGAVLMLCGLVARMFDAHVGLYVYGIGVLLFCLMQVLNYGILRRNEWVVALAIGCVLELYTAWRIPAELEKSKKS